MRWQGSDERLAEAINYLYVHWLERSDEKRRDFPLFLQRVQFYPDVAESQTIIDIYLPLQ